MPLASTCSSSCPSSYLEVDSIPFDGVVAAADVAEDYDAAADDAGNGSDGSDTVALTADVFAAGASPSYFASRAHTQR